MSDFRFQLDGESHLFEDLSKASEQQRRIAGVISTETRDTQGEIVIQKGLNFEPFLKGGVYNDNHSKDTDAVVGWPEKVEYFKKGTKLPDGSLAKANCTWAEGYLLKGNGNTRADKIWDLAQAMLKSNSPRRLGFSIEGTVTKRLGPDRKIVAEANVINTAITNCAINPDTKLETLAKSLSIIATLPEDLEKLEALHKALTMGTGAVPTGTTTGEGAGPILVPQSLECDVKHSGTIKPKRKKKLTKSEAVAWVKSVIPNFREDQIERLISAAINLEQNNVLGGINNGK